MVAFAAAVLLAFSLPARLSAACPRPSLSSLLELEGILLCDEALAFEDLTAGAALTLTGVESDDCVDVKPIEDDDAMLDAVPGGEYPVLSMAEP